jgi:hypothetical protein
MDLVATVYDSLHDASGCAESGRDSVAGETLSSLVADVGAVLAQHL